jgi:hypothetical protein
MSLLSVSMAVHVQVSPAPGGGDFAATMRFCLQCMKAQISSHCTRLAFTSHTFASWNAAQARPASTKSFDTVLMETSHIREIARIDEPSQSMDRIWTRV